VSAISFTNQHTFGDGCFMLGSDAVSSADGTDIVYIDTSHMLPEYVDTMAFSLHPLKLSVEICFQSHYSTTENSGPESNKHSAWEMLINS